MTFRILFVFIISLLARSLSAQTDTVNVFSSGLDQYKIQSFELFVDNVKSEKYSYLIGSFYEEEKINKILETEYSNYVDSGYLNTTVTVSKFEIDTLKKTVSVTGNIEKGELVRVSDVAFSGNRLNSKSYLYKVSGFRDSMIASLQNLYQIKRNLVASQLFEEVSDAEVYADNGKYILFIRTQERNLNQLDGLIGYVPDATGEGQIVGDLNISLWNVVSQGSSFELLYQRLRPETSRLQLAAEQNWLAGLPVSIGLDFGFYQNDTTYQTRNLGLNSSYKISPDLKLLGGVYSITSTSSSENFNPEPDGLKRGSELGFEYSVLDRFEVPTKGIKLELVYGLSSKDLDIDSVSAFNQQRLESSFEGYIPLFERSVIATRLKGFYVVGDEFTENDLIRFGGTNSLRGYSEEQFVASEMLWGDVEYRFLTDRSSYLFLFAATGVYKRPRLITEQDDLFTQNDFLYSGGFGLSYKTAIGRLTFSYALSSTETIGNGKVHFGIKTSL